MRNPLFPGLALALLLSGSVFAAAAPGSKEDVRRQLMGTTLVRGHINIEKDGSVSSVDMEAESKLEPGVVRFVRQTVIAWRFEPILVDGQAAAARSPMSLRLTASQEAEGQMQIRVSGVDFGTVGEKTAAHVQPISMRPPTYPATAGMMGGAGTVYVVLRINRTGRVEQVFAEQVNLRSIGTEQQMQQIRDMLSTNALAAAKRWKFRPPSEGPLVDEPFWTLRVPVSYALEHQRSEDSPALWVAYVPGPLQQAPWRAGADAPGFSPDSLADGGVYTVGVEKGPKLLTPLGG